MIDKLLTGKGIAGIIDYITHDKPGPNNPQPVTADRILHTESLGIPGADPYTMTRCMQGLTADQRDIKIRAGVSTRGRKLTEPYGHIILSAPAGQKLTVDDFREAARGALQSVGISERHYGFLSIHADTDYDHCHVGFSRVDPATGKAATLSHAHRHLSRWARDWEREHGGIVVRGRDPESRAQPRQTRDAIGRLQIRTPEERVEWHDLMRRQREERTPLRVARQERAQLSRQQTARRLTAEGQKVDTIEAAIGRTPRYRQPPRVRPAPEQPARNLRAVPVPTPDRERKPLRSRVQSVPEQPARDLRAIPVPTPDRERKPFRCPVSLVPPRSRGGVAQGEDEVRDEVAHVAKGESGPNGGRGPGETTRGLRDAGAGAPAGMTPPGVGIDAKHDEAKGQDRGAGAAAGGAGAAHDRASRPKGRDDR